EPPPGLNDCRSEGIEVARDKLQRNRCAPGHVADDRFELLELVCKADHVQVQDIDAQCVGLEAQGYASLRRRRPQQRSLYPLHLNLAPPREGDDLRGAVQLERFLSLDQGVGLASLASKLGGGLEGS